LAGFRFDSSKWGGARVSRLIQCYGTGV